MTPAVAEDGSGARRGVLPRLHVVTDDSVLAGRRWERLAADVLQAAGSGACLHLRGPRTDGATLYRLAAGLLPHARRAGARLFVNDRVDIGLALDVDGVHLGARSLPVAVARRLLGGRRWLGVSCHDAAEMSSTRDEGADYAFLGTIFPTPTHPDVAGMGLEGLIAALGPPETRPVIGIGGIDPAGVAGVLATGAYGVAVVRGVWDARDPVAAVRRYAEELDRATTPGRGLATEGVKRL